MPAGGWPSLGEAARLGTSTVWNVTFGGDAFSALCGLGACTLGEGVTGSLTAFAAGAFAAGGVSAGAFAAGAGVTGSLTAFAAGAFAAGGVSAGAFAAGAFTAGVFSAGAFAVAAFIAGGSAGAFAIGAFTAGVFAVAAFAAGGSAGAFAAGAFTAGSFGATAPSLIKACLKYFRSCTSHRPRAPSTLWTLPPSFISPSPIARMGSTHAAETEQELQSVEDVPGGRARLQEVYPWTQLVRKAFSRMQLRDPEAYRDDLADEAILRVLSAAEPSLSSLTELEVFFELCPPTGPEFAAAVPASWAQALLDRQPSLRSLRLRLVPAKIAEEEFWTRYLGAVFRMLEANLMQELDEQTAEGPRVGRLHGATMPEGPVNLAATPGRFSRLLAPHLASHNAPSPASPEPLPPPWKAVRIISDLGRAHKWQEAVGLFWELKAAKLQANTIVWNSVVSACGAGQGHGWRVAIELLSLLENDQEWRPDTITYNNVLTALMKVGRLQLATEFLSEGPNRGFEPDTCSYNIIMGNLAREPDRCDVVLEILEESRRGPGPDSQTFNIAMAACSRAGRWQQAVSMIEDMQEQRVPLDEYGYTTAISACKESGRPSQASELLAAMMRQKMQPSIVTFGAAISACASSGDWSRALSMLSQARKQGLELSTIAFNSAIDACDKGFQWTMALHVLSEMSELQVPPSTSSFNTALHACGECRRWQRLLDGSAM
eukprot:s1738_g5.t1